MTSIRIQVADIEMGDDDDDFVDVPAKWVICGVCHGDGAHSGHLGAITADEWHDNWSPDEQDDYMAGVYDKTCDNCEGEGKVKVIDHDARLTDRQRAAIQKQREWDAIDAEIDAMHRAEIAFGC